MADPNAKCPTCGSDKFTYRPGGERWWCGQCRVSFEVGKNPTPAPVTIEGTVDSGVGGLASTRPALPSTAGGGTRPATRTLSPADIPARDRLDALVEAVRKMFGFGFPQSIEQQEANAALDELAGIARTAEWRLEQENHYRAGRDRLKAALREITESHKAVRTFLGDCTECLGEGCRGHETEVSKLARAALADVGGTEETGA